MIRRHLFTLPEQYHPEKTLFARVDPRGFVDGELQIDTDGVVKVSEGVTDAQGILGVMNYVDVPYTTLQGLLFKSY